MHMMQHDVVCVVGHTPRERVDLSKKITCSQSCLGPLCRPWPVSRAHNKPTSDLK